MDFEMVRLQDVLGGIYDAAMDHSLWLPALQEVASFVGGNGGVLYTKDDSSITGVVSYDFGISEAQTQLYCNHYVKLDPCVEGRLLAGIGEPVAILDLIAYKEYEKTRFFNEWFGPTGLIDCITVIFEKTPAGANFFSVYRGERDGMTDEGARQRIRLLTSHVRRGANIAKLVRTKAAHENSPLADALDCLRAAMFIVNASGRIIHCNVAAQTMLYASDIVRSIRGRVVATCPRAQKALSAVLTATHNGDAAVGAKGIAVPMTAADGEVFVAHVLPLTSARRRDAVASTQARAALFIDRAEIGATPALEAIAKHYKLTPSELRVLLATVEVGRISDVADMLGVAESTVRTHLRRLYDKTEASRQSDLIKLVARFSAPLVR